ncbi:MAG: coagulation factor 5/8 type domain-containing protein, partial [Planctomycetota bacterium]
SGFDVRVGAKTEAGFVADIAGLEGSYGGADVLMLPETVTSELRLDVTSAEPITLNRFRVLTPSESGSANDFLSRLADRYGGGSLPRPFSGEQTLWTIVGSPGHPAESLLSELGSVEIDKGGFSIEPVLFDGDRVLSWADGEHEQTLTDGYLPMPTVIRRHDRLSLEVAPVVDGDEAHAVLEVRYRVTNTGEDRFRGRLGLAVLPAQVLPPWQWLNLVGGYSAVERISLEPAFFVVNGDRKVRLATPADAVAAWDLQSSSLPAGAIEGRVASRESLAGMASGLLAFDLDLAPGAHRDVVLTAGLDSEAELEAAVDAVGFDSMRERVAARWHRELDRVRLDLPGQDAAIAEAIRSTAAYVLINRDGPAIQPGSRTYERAWIRDGSITGAAMLTLGFDEVMREYIEWYAPYQYESGKVPCVVDRRGPDPVDEHDSTGQLIFAIARYVETSGRTGFAAEHIETVARGVEYLESLIAQRSTPEYAGTAYEGIVPESISHEGYSAKPMHSYWDNFFVLQGLRDAAWLASLAGRESSASRWTDVAETFAADLHDSIVAAAAEQHVGYIPGCVELGDFDPTSTAVALAPLSVGDALPQDLLDATLDDYWAWFEARRLGSRDWRDYTPYEMRVIGAFAVRGERDRVTTMLDWFLEQRQPTGWNQWTEIVYSDPAHPGFIGDLPHTWCGSNLINSVSAALVSGADGEVRIARGVPERWFEAAEGFAVGELSTPFGRLSLAYEPGRDEARFTLGFAPTSRWSSTPVVIHLPRSQFEGREVRINGVPVEGVVGSDAEHVVYRVE